MIILIKLKESLEKNPEPLYCCAVYLAAQPCPFSLKGNSRGLHTSIHTGGVGLGDREVILIFFIGVAAEGFKISNCSFNAEVMPQFYFSRLMTDSSGTNTWSRILLIYRYKIAHFNAHLSILKCTTETQQKLQANLWMHPVAGSWGGLLGDPHNPRLCAGRGAGGELQREFRWGKKQPRDTAAGPAYLCGWHSPTVYGGSHFQTQPSPCW